MQVYDHMDILTIDMHELIHYVCQHLYMCFLFFLTLYIVYSGLLVFIRVLYIITSITVQLGVKLLPAM